MGLDYEVQYKKGTEIRVTDALSKVQEIEPSLLTWMSEIELSYEHDPTAL